MSKNAELRREMSRLIGDPTVRKVVRYFELKDELAARKRSRGRAAMLAISDDALGSNWGDSSQ